MIISGTPGSRTPTTPLAILPPNARSAPGTLDPVAVTLNLPGLVMCSVSTARP